MYESNILVLNKSYMPIGKTDWERAIVLMVLGKANSVIDSDSLKKSVEPLSSEIRSSPS